MNSALVKSLTAFLLLLVVVQTRHTFPDTKDGFHYFMVFDTPIFKSGKEIDASRYELVWGASDLLGPMYRKTNPNIILTLYIPFSRDNELNTLEHWKSVHPDWIVYQCDKVTPAGFIGDAPHVPLDISNPEVIEWQVSKYAGMVRDFNYQGIAADNFALGNAMGGCGTWKNGVWNQRWNGQWWDVQYNTDVQNWLKTFYARIQVLSPNTLFGINFCLNGANPMDASVQKVTENVDFILDEAGYTNWGTVLPTPAYHEAMSVWIESIQSKGKHYFGINEFPVLDAQAKEWGMASYMMSKNERSSMVCTTIQGYGYETVLPEYDALNVGSPTASRSTDSNGLVTRSYSNGFAFVNPFNKTANYKIPDVGITYRDVAGKIYKPGDTVTIPGQTGKVMGVSSRITTITTVTTAASATTGGSGGSGAQGSGSSGTKPAPAASSGSSGSKTSPADPTDPDSDPSATSSASFSASFFTILTLLPCTLLFLL